MEFPKETFLRNIEVSSKYLNCHHQYLDEVVLKIHQKYVGDVGCVVWDAALVLLKYIFTESGNKYVNAKHVLELGSGTGVVGIGSIVAGAKDVVITDLPEHLPLMELNINENQSLLKMCRSNNINAHVFHWGNEKELQCALETTNFSVGSQGLCILIADCIYYEDGMLKLYETILTVMQSATSGSCVLCSYEYRNTNNKIKLLKLFFKLLRSCDFLNISFINQSDMDKEYRCNDIDILLITRSVR